MAAREFRGIIKNTWDSPLFRTADGLHHGEWTDPWYPSKVPGAGKIDPNGQGEWRSESAGILTGTAGYALWGVRVLEIHGFDKGQVDDHFEYVQVWWSIPWMEDSHFDVYYGVFPSDPRLPITTDKPTVLELALTGFNNVRGESLLAQAAEIAPYFLALPASFFVRNPEFQGTHPKCEFTLRRRAKSQTSSRLTFPTNLPTRALMQSEAFRHRMRTAMQLGFGAGIPNFHEATNGRRHVGGALLINLGALEIRDVPLADLAGVALDDVVGRVRAANSYALAHGFTGGLPTFYHAGQNGGVVCGTILLSGAAAEAQDIPLSELGNPAPDDLEGTFRAVNNWALSNGFAGGFPTMIEGQIMLLTGGLPRRVKTCGAVLLKTDVAQVQDVLLYEDPA